jgi:hypothetical protein
METCDRRRNLYCTGTIYAYGHHPETNTEVLLYHQKLISTPGFRDIMTQERLEIICKFLHFTDNESISNFEGPQKLFKIFPVISYLNNKFQDLYLPNQDISIDESLTLWIGHLSFKQYIPLKASKFGIKTYELCDATTGYLWSFLVYTGKDTKLDSPLISVETRPNCVDGQFL